MKNEIGSSNILKHKAKHIKNKENNKREREDRFALFYRNRGEIRSCFLLSLSKDILAVKRHKGGGCD